MSPTTISADSLRKMLGLVAKDFGIDDGYGARNPVELTRLIRQNIAELMHQRAELLAGCRKIFELGGEGDLSTGIAWAAMDAAGMIEVEP